MKKIETRIVADSISPQGHRITSFILTYPRFIHSELMTHRVFSRNSASSRAIPFEKMVKMVEEDPFIPIAWQKDHKGMQGNEYINEVLANNNCKNSWLKARDNAIQIATSLNKDCEVTKQLCNRLLEPFMWTTMLITGSKEGWDNFFNLRCPNYSWIDVETIQGFKSKKDMILKWKENNLHGLPEINDELGWLKLNKGQAEIHMMALAEKIYDAVNESTPKQLKAGEWHIPFGDKIEGEKLLAYHYKMNDIPTYNAVIYNPTKDKLKIATARCARLSYMTFDGEIDYEKDIKLHDHLLSSKHMSPFEHCAKAMNDKEYYSFIKGSSIEYGYGSNVLGWCNNFRGWIQYRYLIENK